MKVSGVYNVHSSALAMTDTPDPYEEYYEVSAKIKTKNQALLQCKHKNELVRHHCKLIMRLDENHLVKSI